MGTAEFTASGIGSTAEEAFDNAVRQAQYDHGHNGYTGTIAEKDNFVEITVPDKYKDRPQLFAYELMENDDKRIRNKWGPACCIKLDKTTFMFFGLASC